MATTHHDDLELFAGDDWSIVGVLLDVNGSPLDLTEATLDWTLVDPTGVQVAGVQGAASIVVMTPPTKGQVTITVPAINTGPLLAGRYHDALQVSIGGKLAMYWVGSLLVSSNPFTLIPPFQQIPVVNDYLSGASLTSQNAQLSPSAFGVTSLLAALSLASSGSAFNMAALQILLPAPVVLTAASPSADGQCWFHEPRALALGGKLWFGTDGSNDNTQSGARATLFEVDEQTNAVVTKDMATGSDWGDDHNYPVVLVRSDGRLVCFYCAHRIVAPIRYRVSVNVGTMVGGWSQEYTIGVDSTRPTYPSPVRLSGEGNRVYLLFRDGVAATLSYLTSDDLDSVAPATIDGGALGATPTWSTETQLTQSAGTQGIYTKVHSNNVDRIDILITDAVADTTGHKNDIRHGYWQSGAWHGSDGTMLGDASTLIAFANFTAVATSGAPDNFGDVWVWHIQRRTSGIIEAVFARFVTVSDHRYYYARWDGSAWSKIEIDAGTGSGIPDTRSSQATDGAGAVEGYYSPGLYLDTVNEGIVYCSVGYSTYSVMYRYTSLDLGASWSRQRISGMVKENIRPFVPVGRTLKYSVLWASGDYHFYDFTVASDPSYGYTTHVNAVSYIYSAPTAAPANTMAPVISGVARAGNVLSASTGTWTGDLPMPFSYQWERDGADVPNQITASYTVVSGDIGHTLAVRVTAANNIGSASATSAEASALPINLITESEQINAWTQLSITSYSDVAANPLNAAVTADRIIEQTANSSHSVACPVAISFANATAYTFSFYVKFESRQFVQLLLGAAAFGALSYANFDIQNGTVQTVGSNATAAIVSVGNGWYRISVTATSTAAATTVVGLYHVTAGNSVRAENFAGSASDTTLVYGAQVETGSVANEYVPVA